MQSEMFLYLFSLHAQALEHLVQMNFQDGLFALLAKGKMSEQDGCVEGQRVHILTGSRVHLAASRQRRALCLRLRRRNNVRNAHQLQQQLALLVVLPRDPDRPPRELLHVLCCTRLLCLLDSRVCLRLALESLGELTRLELGGCAIEDVEGLDAVLDHAEGAVEEAHEM